MQPVLFLSNKQQCASDQTIKDKKITGSEFVYKPVLSWIVSCLPFSSVTSVVICLSRAFCLTDQEKRETARSLVLS